MATTKQALEFLKTKGCKVIKTTHLSGYVLKDGEGYYDDGFDNLYFPVPLDEFKKNLKEIDMIWETEHMEQFWQLDEIEDAVDLWGDEWDDWCKKRGIDPDNIDNGENNDR